MESYTKHDESTLIIKLVNRIKIELINSNTEEITQLINNNIITGINNISNITNNSYLIRTEIISIVTNILIEHCNNIIDLIHNLEKNSLILEIQNRLISTIEPVKQYIQPIVSSKIKFIY